MKELLRALCEIDGTSGREDKVRDFILSQIGTQHEYKIDAMGNLIVWVKGRQRAKNTVLVCAHMDEVGVIATYILGNGLIKFSTVGGIQPTALLGKTVKFENGVIGAIGIKPVHLCPGDARYELPEVRDLLIDVGAKTKEEAEQLIQVGDTAVFTSRWTEMGNKLLSKAIDDRAGNAIMINMIKKGVEYDTVFAFNTQEEVGLRGSKTSAYTVDPDYAIVLEATTAADVIDAPEDQKVCVLGKGAVVNFMDRSTLYDKKLYEKVLEIARENGIPAQPKTMVAGGNDAGSVHVSRGGVRTVTLNVPCRYIHSPSSVCDVNDFLACACLAEKVNEYFANAQ